MRLSTDDLIGRTGPSQPRDSGRTISLETGALGSSVCSRCSYRGRSGSATLPRSKAPFLGSIDTYDSAAVAKHLTAAGLAHHLNALADAYRSLEPFDETHTEATLRQVAESGGVKAGTLIHATRIALTGEPSVRASSRHWS